LFLLQLLKMFLRFKIIFLYFQVEESNTALLVSRLLTVLILMTASHKLTTVPVYSFFLPISICIFISLTIN